MRELMHSTLWQANGAPGFLRAVAHHSHRSLLVAALRQSRDIFETAKIQRHSPSGEPDWRIGRLHDKVVVRRLHTARLRRGDEIGF